MKMVDEYMIEVAVKHEQLMRASKGEGECRFKRHQC